MAGPTLERGSETVARVVELARTSNATTKVTLIRPPVVVVVKSISYIAPLPPIGLAYVAAALRAAGHDVTVIDSTGEALEQTTDFETTSGTMRRIGLTLEETVARIPPGTKVVGITNMFLHEWPTVRELAELVKERCPDALVVIGGENATAYHKWAFRDTAAVDCCVLGEGENTAVELVGRVAAGAGFAGMSGVAFRDPELAATTPTGLPVRIRAINEIPTPAWDMFPVDRYLEYQSALSEARTGVRTMPMLASRGCPYKCSFCSSPQMWTTRYVVRDTEQIVDEIEAHVKRYQIDSFDFVDLTAITKHNWTLEFCDELERRGLNVTWQLPIGTRSEGIDEHVLERMYASGCRNMGFAPEHGSQHMLEVYDKRVDLDHILDSIEAAHRVGIATHMHTVVGHPAETWRDRWDNLRFLVKAARRGCDVASAFVFHPYPGSRDFLELVEAGKLVVDDAYVYDGVANGGPGNRSWNPGISSRALYLSQFVMKGTFELVVMVLHPKRAWQLVRTLLGRDDDDPRASSPEQSGPMVMRLGHEYDTRMIAVWLRSRLRRNQPDAPDPLLLSQVEFTPAADDGHISRELATRSA